MNTLPQRLFPPGLPVLIHNTLQLRPNKPLSGFSFSPLLSHAFSLQAFTFFFHLPAIMLSPHPPLYLTIFLSPPCYRCYVLLGPISDLFMNVHLDWPFPKYTDRWLTTDMWEKSRKTKECDR